MSLNTDLQDMAFMRRKRPPENSKRNTRTEERSSGALQRPVLVLVNSEWRSDTGKGTDLRGLMFCCDVQISERTNKLKRFYMEKKICRRKG